MADRKRVLLVVNTYPPQDISGVGELARELFGGLPRCGYDAEVLTRGSSDPAEPLVARVNVPKFFYPPLAPFAFARRLLKRDYALVHLNESDGFAVGLLVWLLRFLRLGGAPILAGFQVSYVEEFRAVRRLTVDGRTLARPSRSELVFKWLRCPIHIACGRLTAAVARRIVVASCKTRLEIIKDYGVAPNRVTVIYNGIDTALAEEGGALAGSPSMPKTTGLELPPGKVVFVFVGRFRIRKGVHFAVEAFRRARLSRDDIALVLVGTGEQDGPLRKFAAAFPAGQDVIFAGKRRREEVFGLFRSCHAFVMPSLYEGFPVAVLEAMAAGLPVLASNVSGIPEAVIDGATGLLHEPGDVERLASHMLTLAADPDRRRSMGREGRRRVAEAFSRERIAALYAAEYDAVIASGTPGRRGDAARPS